MLQFCGDRPNCLAGNVYVEHGCVQRFRLSKLDSRREACGRSDDFASNAFQKIGRRQRHQEIVFHNQDSSSSECHAYPSLLAGPGKPFCGNASAAESFKDYV